jgi:hypothetical protein
MFDGLSQYLISHHVVSVYETALKSYNLVAFFYVCTSHLAMAHW